jgi:hypothetical protein
MKTLKIIAFVILICPLLKAQSSKVKVNTREVIINRADTIIKANVLAGQEKKKITSDLVYFWYLKGTISCNLGGYSGKLLHGTYQEIVNNKLITAGQFKEGLKTSQWKSWYNSGSLKEIYNWQNGSLDGQHIIVSEKGEILKSETFAKGKLIKGKAEISKGSSVIRDYKGKHPLLSFKKSTSAKHLTPIDTTSSKENKNILLQKSK